MKLTILGVDFPVSDKVIYATEQEAWDYINAMNLHKLGCPLIDEYNFGILISQGIGEVDKRMFEYDCILGRTYNAVTESDISTIISQLKLK